MLNLAAEEAAAEVGSVQTVALGEEMLERPRPRLEGRAGRTIEAPQLGRRCSGVGAPAVIANRVAARLAAHPGTKIGEMEPCTSDGDSDGIGSVQAEEPNARLAMFDHVSAHVELRKCGKPGQ